MDLISDYNQPITKNNQSLNTKDFNFIISKINSIYQFDNIHLINCINTGYLNKDKIQSNIISKLTFLKIQLMKK